jgi:hypothetical protein
MQLFITWSSYPVVMLYCTYTVFSTSWVECVTTSKPFSPVWSCPLQLHAGVYGADYLELHLPTFGRPRHTNCSQLVYQMGTAL